MPARPRFTAAMSVFVEPSVKNRIAAIAAEEGVPLSRVARLVMHQGLAAVTAAREKAKSAQDSEKYDVELPFSA